MKFWITNGVWHRAETEGCADQGVMIEIPDDATECEVPDGVRCIGQNAFEDCTTLRSVTLPESVDTICRRAFCKCEGLSNMVLPNKLKKIEKYAFSACANLEDVHIPESVTQIGEGAFYNCRSLKEIAIPDGVKTIGNWAFEYCRSLKKVSLPKSLTKLGQGVFGDLDREGDEPAVCEYIVDKANPVYASDSGLLIDKQRGCILFAAVGLVSVQIPNCVTAIEQGQFSDQTVLETVVIPNSVKKIGDYAFRNCQKLKTVRISKGVSEIGTDIFSGCQSLTQIEVDAANRKYCVINGLLLNKKANRLLCVPAALESVTIPEGVSEVDPFAFKGCDKLTGIRVKEWFGDLTKRMNMDALTAIHTDNLDAVPSKWRIVAANGWAQEHLSDTNSPEAQKVIQYVGKNITRHGDFILSHADLLGLACAQRLIPLKTLDDLLKRAIEAGNAEASAQLLDYQNTFDFATLEAHRTKKARATEKNTEAVVQHAAARAERSKQDGIAGLTFVITGGLSKVWNNRAEVKAYLESYGAKLGGSLTTKTDFLVTNDPDSGSEKNKKAQEWGVEIIDEAEFNHRIGKRFKDQEEIVVPAWIRTIENKAFDSCANLTWISLPEGIKGIGERAFNGCAALKNIVIPQSVETIGRGAFRDCSALTNIEIPRGVKEIGEWVFMGCRALETVVLPNSVTHIGTQAFCDCKALTHLTLPETLTDFGNGAFSYCPNLEGDSDLFILNHVLIKYKNLEAEAMTVPEGVVGIGKYAFENKKNLKRVEIPEGVRFIDAYAFDECGALEKIELPKSLNGISDSAFRGCRSLRDISIPEDVTEIGRYAFSYCISLNRVTLPKGIRKIEEYTFHHCDKLEEIAIPDGVIEIGRGAFENCGSLTRVYMPDSVKKINEDAFSWCYDLKEVSVPRTARIKKGYFDGSVPFACRE